MIRGHLAAAGPLRPGTLIVNGNPIPVYTGEGGRFARPYVFGFGSNSLEVRHPDGKSGKRVSGTSSPPW